MKAETTLKLNAYAILRDAITDALDEFPRTEVDAEDNAAFAWLLTEAVMRKIDAVVEWPSGAARSPRLRHRAIILVRVLDGIKWGLVHAFKHTATPEWYAMLEHIDNDIHIRLDDVLLPDGTLE